MIALDATPLVLGPRRGVARAFAHLLQGLSAAQPAGPVLLVAPGPLPSDVRWGGRVAVAPTANARAFRRLLPDLLVREGATVYVSPWSAFPRDLPGRGVAVVAVVHELPFVRLGPIEGRLRTWNHLGWLRRDVEDCAAIVVPSRATQQDLLALHPEAAEKVRCVPWGFDPTPWDRAAGGPAQGPVDGPALVVGAGGSRRGARKKGLDVVAAAARRFGGEVLLVGEGVVPEDLPRNVHRAGRLDDAGLVAALQRASMLLYVSRSEGFGYPPLEAMAAGVPVVAADAGAIPEVCGDAAEYVPPGDAAALATAMERVRTDAARRSELVAAGRQRARMFPVHEAARRFLAVAAAARSPS